MSRKAKMYTMFENRIAIIISLFFFLSTTSVYAQVGSTMVKGIVQEENGKPVVAASISLFRVADSSIVKILAADEQGRYAFENIENGAYFMSVSAIGFLQHNTAVFKIAGQPVFLAENINLPRIAKELQGITVKSTKPLIEVKADRMVLNVSSSLNALGSNALALLRKSPWVKVDNNNNLSVNGKNGVNVYIDGKPTNVSGGDLANVLTNLQSANIEAIEIITNPSSRYPAEGNAGVINIRLKKNIAYGFNGSVSLTASEGYSPKYDASANLNYRNKAFNIFGNYGYRNGDNRVLSSLIREQKDGNYINTFDQNVVILNKDDNHNFKGGMDFFLSGKSMLGIMANGSFSNGPFTNTSVTDIYRVLGETDSVLRAANVQERRVRRLNYNINYQYQDTMGRSLNVDADYSVFKSNADISQPNEYMKPDGSNIRRNDVRTTAFTDIGITSFKIDYEQLAFSGKLSLGIFSNNVKTKNDFNYYNVDPGDDTLNLSRSRLFDYREHIQAAYISYYREIRKITLQIGLRGEATGAEGDLTTYVASDSYRKLDTSYFNLFPNASLDYKFNDDNSLNLSFSRRIDRPGYEDLNPFENPLDELTFSQGNTFIKPQYTNNIQLAYIFKQFTASLSYSKTKDYFTKVLDTVGTNKTVQTIKNIDAQHLLNLNLSAQLDVTKWWNASLNASAGRAWYKGVLERGVLNVSNTSFSAAVENSLEIAKDISAQLSAYYNGPWLDATMQWKANWSIDAGMQKKIFKGNGSLKLAVTDIFNTSVERGIINFGGTFIRGRFKGETRQVRLSFDIRFGSNSVKQSRERATSADVERNRLK